MSTTKSAPVVVLRGTQSNTRRHLGRVVPAALASFLVHGVLLLLFFMVGPLSQAETQIEDVANDATITADLPQERLVPFEALDVATDEKERGADINSLAERFDKITVPGEMNPQEAIGQRDGKKDSPVNAAPQGGFGGFGESGALASFKIGNDVTPGDPGGDGRLPSLPGGFLGRSKATRELRAGVGTSPSEAAVASGLRWLIRHQMPDGRWMLDSPTLPAQDRGTESNDIAATALGLLPLLATGKTHKPAAENPYDKNIGKALRFLMRSQDAKTGYFGGSMYAHGLATITLCEAFGLSQDPSLRRSAQAGINLIVNTQHEGGGWRYGPAKQPGDLSISGWQIMALKSGQMAGLDVPSVSIRKAVVFLDSCGGPDDGYGYTGPGSTHRMTAVGLLCRQYIQHWGPAHPRMIKSVARFINPHPPETQDVYFTYYATQVMHHFGGDAGRDWNEKIRAHLVKKQDANPNSPNFGSWSPQGDPFARVGGRLMMTSMNLLTLEVHYRYLPLFSREAGARS